jgi:hypothetical protein
MSIGRRLAKLEQAAAADATEADRPFCKSVALPGADHRTIRKTLQSLGYTGDDLQETGKWISWWIEGRSVVMRTKTFDPPEWVLFTRFFHNHQRRLREQAGNPRRFYEVGQANHDFDAAFDRFDAWRAGGCPHKPVPAELEGDEDFYLVAELALYAMEREGGAT